MYLCGKNGYEKQNRHIERHPSGEDHRSGFAETQSQPASLCRSFGYEEGFLLTLQAFYEIAAHKNRMASDSVSGTPAIRRSLFWDTDFDTINWGRHKRAVIGRVLERGNEAEKREIARFYGIDPATLDSFKPKNAYRINITK